MVSQLPVLENGRLIGLVDESDLLLAVAACVEDFQCPVRTAMVTRLETIEPDAPISALLPISTKNYVAVVEGDGQFYGLITRIDLLNHLRLKVGTA